MKLNNNIMRIKTIILGIALAAGSFASCSVEDNESTAESVKENYTREFIKQFGIINPNQDWSVVEQKSVTVALPKAAHVQVFEKQGDEYRLAADYKDVTKKTITFDGLEGDNSPFIVYVDNAGYAVENGGTLAFGASAAKHGPMRASKLDGTTWVTRSYDQTKIWLSSSDRVLNVLRKNDGTSTSYQVVVDQIPATMTIGLVASNTPMTLYPMYWNSKKTHEFGIFYHDKTDYSKIVHVPVYSDKDGVNDDLSYYPSTGEGTYGDTAYPAETDAKDSWTYTHTKTDVATGADGTWEVQYTNKKSLPILTRGYTIHVPNLFYAGYYVKVDGKYYYSEVYLNKDNKDFFAQRTVHRSGDDYYTYLCFDDPDDNGGEGDRDFNDLVMYIPEKATYVTTTETEWTVACEDLGGTFDYDFNDVVFRMSHVAGHDYATITPVAAGGTLSAKLCYNGKEISDEWHQHFGNGYEPNVMINTGRGPSETSVKTILLSGLPTDWSMSKFSKDSNGFSIKVKRADGYQTSVTGPDKGAAPQMLILPYDWQWPTELTNITDAYPGFGEWGANYTNSSWVNTKVADKVVEGFSSSEITPRSQMDSSAQ